MVLNLEKFQTLISQIHCFNDPNQNYADFFLSLSILLIFYFLRDNIFQCLLLLQYFLIILALNESMLTLKTITEISYNEVLIQLKSICLIEDLVFTLFYHCPLSSIIIVK